MRFTLPESSHRRQRSPGGTVLSTAIHALAIGGMLAATGMSAEGARAPTPAPETLIYLRENPEPRPLDRRDPRPPAEPLRDAHPTRIELPSLPPSNVLVDASVVPTEIPDVGQPLGAPFDSTMRSMGAGEPSSGSSRTIGDGSLPMSSRTVDREVVPLRGIVPRYPAMLASANIEGSVVMQFVVDTLGRVEKESVQVLRADHPQFEQSVRDALARMRFVPAEARGRRVRQLVEQPFTFALDRRD